MKFNNQVKIHRSSNMHWVGDGFPVKSVFGYNDLGQELSPFLLLDYAEPYYFEASQKKRGVGAHPHRGFETVTLAYQGEIEHRDSGGGGGIIGPGDVQWMTAAGGVVHDEFHSENFTQKGGNFEMVQLWVNLPAKFKNHSPKYQQLKNENIPVIKLPDDSGEVRVIAGRLTDKEGPAQTFTRINLWEINLNPNKSFSLDLPAGDTKAVLVLRGKINLNEATGSNGDLLIMDTASSSALIKAETPSKLLVLSGEPINEPIVGYGPFVMNSKAEIRQAYDDYEQGKFGRFV